MFEIHALERWMFGSFDILGLDGLFGKGNCDFGDTARVCWTGLVVMCLLVIRFDGERIARKDRTVL